MPASAKFFGDSMSRISFILPLVPTIQNMNSFLLNISCKMNKERH